MNNNNYKKNIMSGQKVKSQSVPEPSDELLRKFFKLSLKKDKPIDLHYYHESYNGNVAIKTVDGDDKILVNTKYEDEDHTSEIKETYSTDVYLLMVTANSIYVMFDKSKLTNK